MSQPPQPAPGQKVNETGIAEQLRVSRAHAGGAIREMDFEEPISCARRLERRPALP
jgi:hypothetical protein